MHIGHPGRRIAVANYTITYNNLKQHMDHYGKLSRDSGTLPGYEIWAKPQPNNTWAVLLMNLDGNHTHDITVNFKDIPWNDASAVIRDIVNHKDLGTFSSSFTSSNIPPFGSTFVTLSPVDAYRSKQR